MKPRSFAGDSWTNLPTQVLTAFTVMCCVLCRAMPSPSTSVRGVRALIAVASVAAVGVSVPAAIAATPNADTASKKTLRLATPDKKPAIVNGQPIDITQVPYQVFVQASVGG